MTFFISFVVCFFLYLFWEHRALQRRREECGKIGHLWEPADMGDDPRAEFICRHCTRELHYDGELR